MGKERESVNELIKEIVLSEVERKDIEQYLFSKSLSIDKFLEGDWNKTSDFVIDFMKHFKKK